LADNRADFHLLKFPDRDRALAQIRDLTCLSNIWPTGYHAAVTAGVGPGSTMYIAGAGPAGMAAAASARLPGAAVAIVGDVNPLRLAHARAVGFETVDLSTNESLGDQIAALLGTPSAVMSLDKIRHEIETRYGFFERHLARHRCGDGRNNPHVGEAPAPPPQRMIAPMLSQPSANRQIAYLSIFFESMRPAWKRLRRTLSRCAHCSHGYPQCL
jgi:hypothetical protein